MPPKHVGEELRELIKKVRDGTFEYKNREEAGTNWAKYDYAQIHEMANYLDNLREIVDEADNRIRSRTIPEKRGPGRWNICMSLDYRSCFKKQCYSILFT